MSTYYVTENNITTTIKCPECGSCNLNIQNQYDDGDEYECLSCDSFIKITDSYRDELIQEEIDKQEEINLTEEDEEINLRPLFVKRDE